MPILVAFHQSPRAGKRYRMVLANPRQVIDFGLEGGYTHVDGASEKVRDAYLSRHGKEDWTKISPGSASRYILWGSPDIEQNLKEYVKRFKIEVPKGAIIRLKYSPRDESP
jgi:hypothetical protein